MNKKIEEINNMKDFKSYLDYPRISNNQNNIELYEDMRFNTCKNNPESMISWFKKNNTLYLIRVSKECIEHINKCCSGDDNLTLMCNDLRFVQGVKSRIIKDGSPLLSIEILMPGEFSESENNINAYLQNEKIDKLSDNEKISPKTSKDDSISNTRDYAKQSEKEKGSFEDKYNPIRVSQYLRENNINLQTLNAIAEFTYLNRFSINEKLDEETLILLNRIILAPEFNNWLRVKLTYDKTKIENAKGLIKNLTYGAKTDATDIVNKMDESENIRIINALQYLVNLEYYDVKKNNFIQEIISSEKSLTTKIHQLNSYFHEQPNNYLKEVRESSYDDYEDFQWGGINGRRSSHGLLELRLILS